MNWPTIIVAVLILAGVAAVIVNGIKRKKQGKSSCGCSCAGCPMSGKCHKK